MSQDQVLLERAVIFCLYKQGTFDGSYFGDSPRLKAGKICTNPGKEHPVRTHDNPESLEEKGGINQKGQCFGPFLPLNAPQGPKKIHFYSLRMISVIVVEG